MNAPLDAIAQHAQQFTQHRPGVNGRVAQQVGGDRGIEASVGER